jgi:ligand-binding SRPBCC domain-containing protein
MTAAYRLVREQMIGRPLEEVFTFFADARNLETLTPPWLRFQILTPGEIQMQAGTILQYALRIHGLPVHWTTVIDGWKPPYEFVDVQLRGPYVLWHHRHTFEARGDATRMIDEVSYALPFGFLGRVVQRFFVRRDLEMIFDFRARTIEQIFGRPTAATTDARRRSSTQIAAEPSS